MTTSRDRMSLENLWLDLRQGARNIAGVTWQVAASVHLLVLARAGDLPFVSVTPEGFEDLDCTSADGTRTFVQMKEVAAGDGRLTASDIADALKHAEDAARGASIVVVTDGQFGSGLRATGWDGVIGDQPAGPVDHVAHGLTKRGLAGPAARALLFRSRLVHLPWRLREVTEARLTSALGLHPTVASFAVDQLYAAIAASAAAQRTLTRSDARTHTVADVDTAVGQVQSAVDTAGLEAAVAAGVCVPADFLTISGLRAEEFYAGVDGSPAHIAAQLDVPRPTQMDEIRAAAQHQRYALMVGPSGSGKSVLLWRAARDAVPGARVLRVRRLATAAQSDLLVRHVRSLRPSKTSPVVVAADNLGRPGMGAWAEAAAELRETADVILMGACRAEDFHPSLITGPTRIIELVLDEATALDVAARVEATGVHLAMAAQEAVVRSQGLLMEFLALLTTGTRLEQVLANQAHSLAQPGRELECQVARLLTAAHSIGLGVHADRLGHALGGDKPSLVGNALAALRGEHVVITDGMTWTGLHELRSRTLTTLLHVSPPPTLAGTFAATLGLLDPAEAGWLLRRVAERDPEQLWPATLAAAEAIGREDVSAQDAAVLLEGAERADNAVYANLCLPVLTAALSPGISVHNLAFMTYGVRQQGVTYSRTGSVQLDTMYRTMERIGHSLPPRPAATCKSVAAGLSAERLAALVLGAELPDVVRLLEAGAGMLPVTSELARSLLTLYPGSRRLEDVDLWPRLVDALHASLRTLRETAQDNGQDIAPIAGHSVLGDVQGAAGNEEWHTALGPVENRALQVAQADPNAVELVVAPLGTEVTLTLLHPPTATVTDNLAWDSASPDSRNDIANTTAVAAARRLAAACPELATVEIITVTPSGRRYRVDNLEPGHKRLPTASAFPDRTGVRRNVGFQSALRRLTAAGSWTAALRQQIVVSNDLADLVAHAPARLAPNDNQGRRRVWSTRVNEAVAAAAALSDQPAATGVDPSQSHAHADDAQRRADLTSQALSAVAIALPRVLTDGGLPALAATFWDAADKLEAAKAGAAPVLTGLGTPVSPGLVSGCRRLARVLAALADEPSEAHRIRAGDLEASTDQLAAAAAQRIAHRQQSLLSGVLGGVPAVVHHVQDPAPPSWMCDGTSWVVAVAISRWDELCQVLEETPQEVRTELSGRVLVAAQDGGQVLLCARLTSTGDRVLLPVTPDVAEPLLSAAGLSPAERSTSTAISEVIDSLIHLSWATTRNRIRPPAWPIMDPSRVDTLAECARHAEAVCERLDEPDREHAQVAFTVLLQQVQRELDGLAPVSLAAVMLEVVDPAACVEEATDLWSALTILHRCGITSVG